MILDRIDQWFRAVERFGNSIARRKKLAVAICGLLVLVVRLAELPRMPVPDPRVRDEFSYLLAADTFASGRLTNPQHPMWTHLESIHILQTPTYMSMYPPAQGLFLALGQKLASVPWIGVLLTMSLCCASLCWMLEGWLPPGWAFFGGLLIAMKIGVFTYWMNSYYGGAVAALGGALLFGALPRIMRRPNVRDALLFALGLALLANSRPYEGFVAAVPAVGALLWWFFRSHKSSTGLKWLRVAIPVILVILASAAWIGYYNFRVTGSALVMPQQLNRQQYAVAPYFMWESLRPDPPYRHEVLRRFYAEWESGFQLSDQQDTLEGWLASARDRFFAVWVFYLGTALTVPLLMLPYALRDRRMRFWIFAAPIFLMGLVLARFTQAHYVAPMIGGLYVLAVQSMRHMSHIKWGREQAGIWVVRAIAIVVLFGFARSAAAGFTGTNLAHRFDRAAVEKRLEEMTGPQLVMVRYGENHYLDQEWVYNRADVDHAKVVWAREMALRSDNVDLQAYFHNRTCWVLEPDVDQEKLVPCPPLAAP